MSEKKGSFWSNLPAVITATAGLVTAVGGVIYGVSVSGDSDEATEEKGKATPTEQVDQSATAPTKTEKGPDMSTSDAKPPADPEPEQTVEKQASTQSAQPSSSPSQPASTSNEISGAYRLVQVSSGRYLDAFENGELDYNIILENYQNDDSQVWMIDPQGGDSYTIRQKSTGRYMDAFQASDKGKDCSNVTRNAQGDATQRWILRPQGQNLFTVQQESNRRYVDAHESGPKVWSVVTRDPQNNNSQVWRLERAH